MSYDIFRGEPDNRLLVGEQPVFGANVRLDQSQLGSNIEKRALGETAVDFFDNDFFGVPASGGLTAAIAVTLDDVAPAFGAQLASSATVAVALADASVAISGSLGAAGLTAAVQVQLADVAPVVAAQLASTAAVAVTLDSISVSIAASGEPQADTGDAGVYPIRRPRRAVAPQPVSARLAVQLDGVVVLFDALLEGRARAARDEEWRQLRRAA